MYYPFFLTYMLTGLIISCVVFVWALRQGQFTDQQRALFLPLEETDPVTAEPSARGRLEIYAILFLIIAGIGASFAVIFHALISQ